MTTPIHCLVDCDILAFTAASAAQYVYHDEFGYSYPVAHRPEAEAIVDNMLWRIKRDFTTKDGTEPTLTLVLTDPKENWRREVWPDYKANRKDNARPVILDYCKDYLREKGAFHWDGLEADDVLGILLTAPQPLVGAEGNYFGRISEPLSTHGRRAEEERVIVGKDKDFLTVPGKYHRIGHYTDVAKTKPLIIESSPWQAKRWHMIQTLAGDRTDGYPGCKNIGMERAERIIDQPELLVQGWGVITRGINKGNSVPKWTAEPSRNYWAVIVSNYRKADLTEEDALVTARLAHILHWEDYRDGKAILWTPDKLLGLGA